MKLTQFSLFNLMRFGPICLSIFLTFGSQFSQAAFVNTQATCTDIDYVRKHNLLGEARGQGDIGWCYANAAADLLSYEYRDQLHNKPASAMYMALTFTDTFIGKNFFEGGSAYFALKAYAERHKNVCLQSTEDKVLNNGFKGRAIKERLAELMLLKTTFDNAFIYKTTSAKPYLDQWKKLKGVNSYIFAMGDDQLREVLATSNIEDFPDNVADTLCSLKDNSKPVNQKSEVGGAITYQDEDAKNQAVQAINKQLSNKNIVGLAYQASVLVEPDVAVNIDSAHLSVLVGRRWNKNHCEYLIRNSWGHTNACYNYRNSPIFKNLCTDDGYVWIPESIMKKSMIGISYYDKNPTLTSNAATLFVKAVDTKPGKVVVKTVVKPVINTVGKIKETLQNWKSTSK